MNQGQDKKMHEQGKPGAQGQTGGGGLQSHKPQGGNRPETAERGNPNTTERLQPEPNRGGGQRQEGEKPTGSQQPKF